MNEVIKALLLQMLGYLIAMGFSFVLMNFWQRGYFWAYIRVRTSLDKLILVKIVEVTKIRYKVGRIEEGNLLWGRPGKDGKMLFDIQKDYIYREQNVNCVDVDAFTFAFIPKEVHYAKVIKPIPADAKPEDYRKIFDKHSNEIIVAAIEGFDPGKIDSFVQAAQMRPSQITKTMQLILMIALVGLVISAAGTFAGFMAGDNVKKVDAHLSSVGGQVDKVVTFITPSVNGSIVATG